ncbi:outer membrane protein assembly factor BamA [Erythrobacter sp. 3-20A1M]|uniref:outer membrane protein assembly factor BamA n=1 Tax=Erythrobacter sp. 3-20A1M TaxID=2653850 RepID=UPI001BFCC22B|nr:outer membrane protein assembly factor BamA [Erythrobacter sp. 3-20A1M]QWC57718.1 outer membrane protein assembly factor BamA [Erythrobacter sp. 3-20A1M]
MNGSTFGRETISQSHGRFILSLLGGSILAGLPLPALAQETQDGADAPATSEAQAPRQDVIRTISVRGAQRLEPQTILSYINLRPGQVYTAAAADQALKDLGATELFSSFSIRNENGDVIIDLTENPVINRIILEGNKRLKNDKILPEIKLAPRQIFTRSKVRADVARIIELYKRQGRFAATVEPQTVQLSQNRVDLVFEINEGPKSKVRQINIIGNEKFSDGDLRDQMVTKQTGFLSFLKGNTSYDPDKLAFDQQKLREFYLTEGYADFRVVSAVAELTPDKEDFIITYVVEEGERYKFGDVKVESQIRDFDSEGLTKSLTINKGDWYNAKTIDDAEEGLTELAGTFGYAFADVRSQVRRNPETKTMDITLVISEAPRVYVERVDVNGNTLTQDKVVRREMRLVEGDAFNTLQVKRSSNRIASLRYFQDNFEIEQKEGSEPDRIVLEANVEEQPTGELQLSAGFSSLERFLLAASIKQRNFRGRGQTVGASVQWSRYSRSFNLSFSDPYVFDRNLSLGVDVYRRDLNSFNFIGSNRQTTYEQSTTGASLRLGFPVTEYIYAIGSYTLNFDDVSVDESTYFLDLDGDGIPTCEPLLAGRYLCDALGKRTSSILGMTLNYSTLNNSYHPSRGNQVTLTAEYAGLGGSVKFARVRGSASKFWPVLNNFIFSLRAEGGYIKGFGSTTGVDDVRLTDRFQLGEPEFRGFDIRGVGPRVLRQAYDTTTGEYITQRDRLIGDDALGGKAYYLGHAELEIPLGSGAKELGLRPSVFVDVGALFNVERPQTTTLTEDLKIYQQTYNGVTSQTTNATAPDGTANIPLRTIPAFRELFLGDTAKPRVTVGIGVNWNSPFGPFRIDFARAVTKQPGDDTKTFTFNVGTQF